MEIKHLEQEDLPVRISWMNDKRVYSSMHFSIPVSLEDTIEWYEKNKSCDSRYDASIWDNGEIVAFCGISSIKLDTGVGELYVFVNPLKQGKGIGTSAIKLLCKYAFTKLALYKICLMTNEDNYAAQVVYERCGFKLEGRMRNEYLSETGVLLDRLYYGLLKNEFECLHQ